MCFQFYEGKGYSADFTDHMGQVIKELEADPEQKVVYALLRTRFLDTTEKC